MSADTRTVCRLCGSGETLTLRPGWDAGVEAGEGIPIVGCGNPWHYAFPTVSLGPYSLADLAEQGGRDVMDAVAAADSVDVRIVTAVRLTRVDRETGEEVALPAACLSCGYAEVPGADFEAHDCGTWSRASPAEKEANQTEHFAECHRRMAEPGGTA